MHVSFAGDSLLTANGQSNPKVKAGKEGAFEATVKFLKKHL